MYLSNLVSLGFSSATSPDPLLGKEREPGFATFCQGLSGLASTCHPASVQGCQLPLQSPSSTPTKLMPSTMPSTETSIEPGSQCVLSSSGGVEVALPAGTGKKIHGVPQRTCAGYS